MGERGSEVVREVHQVKEVVGKVWVSMDVERERAGRTEGVRVEGEEGKRKGVKRKGVEGKEAKGKSVGAASQRV